MRMTWIKTHWEPDFISDAEEKIRKTVRLFIWAYPRVVLTYPQKDD